MSDFEFRFVWQKCDPRIIEEARAFWLRLGVLNEDQVEARAEELCALAYSGDKLAAVASANFFDSPRLRGRFFYYRTTVATEFRQQRIAARLCHFSWRSLGEWARVNVGREIKGLITTFESEEIFAARRAEPIMSAEGADYVLVGYTPTGLQIRVIWFDGATVD